MIKNKIKNSPILMLDSGVGGLSILYHLSSKLPYENIIYFADFNNSPYGKLDIDTLQNIVVKKLEILVEKYQPKCIVLACNTATASCLDIIKRKFTNCLVIGTEPSLCQAIKKSKKILLMATNSTVKNSYLVNIIRNFIGDKLNIFADKNLAKMIDDNIYDLNKVKEFLYKKLSKYVGEIDSIVLGCTHYYFIKNYLKDIFGENIQIFDSVDIVVKNVLNYLDYLDLKKCNSREFGSTLLKCDDMLNNSKLLFVWDKLKKGGTICVE